jgi:CheY-like chemotaxis protein
MQAPEAEQGESGRLVLVVEDDRPTRELLSAILREEGLPFHVTSTGHEAMEYVRQHPPALVVLDMHLPNLQGDAVATALKIELGHSLPIIAMSASNEQALAEHMGALAYIQKPFNVEDLAREVRRGLALAAVSAARGGLESAAARQRMSFERVRGADAFPPRDQAAS